MLYKTDGKESIYK